MWRRPQTHVWFDRTDKPLTAASDCTTIITLGFGQKMLMEIKSLSQTEAWLMMFTSTRAVTAPLLQTWWLFPLMKIKLHSVTCLDLEENRLNCGETHCNPLIKQQKLEKPSGILHNCKTHQYTTVRCIIVLIMASKWLPKNFSPMFSHDHGSCVDDHRSCVDDHGAHLTVCWIQSLRCWGEEA